MAQKPVNRDSPAHHQPEREWQRDQRDAATEPQARKRVERERERDPRQTQRLDQSQHKLAPVVHREKVVQVEKVESGETEETCNGCFPVTILFNELKLRAFHADAQVYGGNDRAVDEYRLGNDQ